MFIPPPELELKPQPPAEPPREEPTPAAAHAAATPATANDAVPATFAFNPSLNTMFAEDIARREEEAARREKEQREREERERAAAAAESERISTQVAADEDVLNALIADVSEGADVDALAAAEADLEAVAAAEMAAAEEEARLEAERQREAAIKAKAEEEERRVLALQSSIVNGVMLCEDGDYAEASKIFQQAMVEAQDIGDVRLQAKATKGLAGAYRNLDASKKLSGQMFEIAASLFESVGDTSDQIDAVAEAAESHRLAGHKDLAVKCLERYDAHAVQHGHKPVFQARIAEIRASKPVPVVSTPAALAKPAAAAAGAAAGAATAATSAATAASGFFRRPW